MISAEEKQTILDEAEELKRWREAENELLSKLDCSNGRCYMAAEQYDLIDDVQNKLKLLGKLLKGVDLNSGFDLSVYDFETLGIMLEEMGDDLQGIVSEAKLVPVD